MAVRRYGRSTAVSGDDSDLHVDVMRFFAIIAMCLFAILPHMEVPKVEPVSGLQQRSAVTDDANLSAINPIIATTQAPQGAQLFQRAPAFQSDQPGAHIDHDTLRPASSKEQAVVKEIQEVSVSAIASAGSSQKEKELPAESELKQEDSVRFLNSDAFKLAVTSGAITLLYHNQNENLVFDPAISRFTRLVDVSLQMFGLATSEVPPFFYRALPRTQRANMPEAQWFITLPEATLAYLLEAQQKNINGAVLNDSAQPL